jgi:hypothetical protein
MAKYMLLLYDDPTAWQQLSPEELQNTLQKYLAWSTRARADGIYVGGHKLANNLGKVVRGKAQVHVTDGPYSETKEVLAGYQIIEMPDYEAAVDRCRDHPHLQFGTIEVRDVDPLVGGGA